MNQLTTEETEAAAKELIVKFPRVERLPVDPPIAGQNYGLFSFKFLPKPVNGVYGFLKFRGAFVSQEDCDKHAENIIRTIDSKHRLWPYGQGRWLPITTNEDFAKEVLEVGQQKELSNIYNQRETDEQKVRAQQVREIKSRERKLIEESRRKEFDNNSMDYYAQQVMKVQQLESWLEHMRKRKRDMLKALTNGHEEVKRIDEVNPEYKNQVDEKIRYIKEGIGLDADAPIDQPSWKAGS